MSLPKHLDQATRAWSLGERAVGGEERDVEQLGERHIRGVIHGEVVSKLPASIKQRSMPHTVDTQPLEVSEGQASTTLVEFAASNEAAPRRGHLQIEEVGRGQALTTEPISCAIAVGPVVCEGGHDDARIDNDQRASRSARTADAAA